MSCFICGEQLFQEIHPPRLGPDPFQRRRKTTVFCENGHEFKKIILDPYGDLVSYEMAGEK